MSKIIRIGTRGSKLALWQADYLAAQLAEHDIQSEQIIISTKGDRVQDLSFDKIEGKGFFTKEIEDSLLADEIDLAVHSLKDMPTTPVDHLTLSGVSYREEPNDCLLIKKSSFDSSQILGLKQGAVVGTSSARRKAMIQNLVPHVALKDIRGNVPTRVDKLRNQDFDAIILAAAGLNRLKLDLSDLEVKLLHPKEFVPAPGQGVIVYQCRTTDLATRRIVKKIHNSEVSMCTNVERKVLQMMEGGCQLPLGVHCTMDAMRNFHVSAAYSPSEGAPLKQVSMSQNTNAELAELVYEQLMSEK